jgi:uncharacterized membrane protein YeiH
MHETFGATAVHVLEWVGTLAFAISGGLLGAKKRFDLFGILFLSFVVAVAGGVMRDVLIGAVPPAAFSEIHYFAIAVSGGLITFFWARNIAAYQRQIQLVDAFGLGLFAVVGAQKALEFGIHPVMAAVMGMVTGIGGGMIRDVLAGEIPFVLRSDLYAVAALAAGAAVAVGKELGISEITSMLVGAVVCIVLRLLAIYCGWRVPTAPDPRSIRG